MAKVHRFNVVQTCMLLLCCLLFLNLNASFEYVLGIRQFVSPVVLLLCLILFIKISRLGMIPYFTPVTVFFLFIILYIVVGTMGALIYESFRHPRTVLYKNVESLVNCFIISFTFFAYTIYAHITMRFERFLSTVFVLTWIGSLCVLLFNTFGIQITSTELGDRGSGLFANPNEAGIVATINIVLGYFFIMRRSANNWIYFVGMGFSVIAVLLTLSKSALAMLLLIVFAALLWFGFNLRKIPFYQRRVFMSMYLVLFFLGCMVYWNWSQYVSLLSYSQLVRLEQFIDLLSGQLNVDVTSQRNVLFAEAFSISSQHPITGVGLGNISRMKGVGLGAHNTFLMVWGESGIFVAGIFVALIAYMLYRCLRFPNLENRFLHTGLMLILIFQSYMVTHNGFDFRISNALFGICMGSIYFYSRFPNAEHHK